LTEKSRVKPIIGFSNTETVKLDFDNTLFRDVLYWALRAMRRFKLEGFIVLKSSRKSYHVVFNRKVSWSDNLRVVAWIALLSRSPGLQRFCLMQCIKKSSTLRVSRKREKPSPRIVYRLGKQEKQVKDYMKARRLIMKIVKCRAIMAVFPCCNHCFLMVRMSYRHLIGTP
jgi:hypothetical protein